MMASRQIHVSILQELVKIKNAITYEHEKLALDYSR